MKFRHTSLDGSDNDIDWKDPVTWLVLFFVFILPLVIVPIALSFYIGDLAYKLVLPTIITTAGYIEMLRRFNSHYDR